MKVKIPLVVKIMIGFVLGTVMGLVLSECCTPETTRKVLQYVSPFGNVLVAMLKMVVYPIILFSLILGAASLPLKKSGKVGGAVLAWYFATSVFATIFGVVLAYLLNPSLANASQTAGAENLAAVAKMSTSSGSGSLGAFFVGLFQNPFSALANGQFLPIIVFSIGFGLCARWLLDSSDTDSATRKTIETCLATCDGAQKISFKLIDCVIHYFPIGVFALSVVNFGENGVLLFGPYARITLCVVIGVVSMIVLVYPLAIAIFCRENPYKVILRLREPILTAFVTRSSAATLPVSFKAADGIGIDRKLSSFSLPMGATVNMDGVCVHLPVFVILAANMFGHNLGIIEIGTLCVSIVFASVGAGGIPGGSVFLLFMVLENMGLPADQVALIVALCLGINPILDMFETCCNVAGDNVCTYIVAKKNGMLNVKAKFGLMAAVALFAGVSFGMTEDEFAQAIAAAEDGGTVEITSDFTFKKSVTIDKSLTITSGEGGPYVLSRDVNYMPGTIFIVNGSGISVELKDLTITGKKEENPQRTSSSVIQIKSGKLTFGSGLTIKDFLIGTNGGIAVSGSSAKLYMKDGARITGFECWYYGTAIIIGTGGPGTGWFFMEGGEISGCAGHSPHPNDPEWDGVAYLYGGNMSATGGRIINNTSDSCVAGINVYKGNFYFGGDFVCTNNIGALGNDCFLNKTESNLYGFYFVTTNYTGVMTVRMRDGDPTHGTAWTVQSWTKIWDESAQGYPDQARSLGLGWEGVSYETDPELILSLDPPQGNWYGVWRKRAYNIYDADGNWVKSNWKALPPASITVVPIGGTLELHKDWNLTEALTISNALTITSFDPDNPCVILHADNSSKNLLAGRNGAEILLQDIILDGGGAARSFGNGCSACSVRDGAVVTLGKGTVIRSAVAATYGSALIVYDQNSKAIMEDGALITDCTATAGGAYGAVVIIGTSTTIEGQGPVFEMRGGLITRCSCPGRTTPTGGYSGIVYAYNSALFDMSGGAITGNTSDACAGVVAYCGKVRISGRATIKDNDCPYPGIWLNPNGSNETLRFYGQFNGYVQLCAAGAVVGEEIAKVNRLDAETNVNGARCLHSVDNTLVGKWNGSKVVWAPRPAAKLILK